MTAGDVAVRLDAVTKRFGKVVALDGMSFEVQRGRLFVVFGPSSVGKTTTLRAIAGLERPQEGRLEINGRDVTQAPIAGRNVSMVFQSFALYPHLTVRENFAYPLKEAGTSAGEIAQRIDEIAEILSLGHRLDNKPETLSGGEQQRVALGRSLIRRPDILLLDEPLTNLDAKLRDDMRTEIKRLHRQFGITIVYATPDELEALSMGEEIAVLREGRVVQTGTPDELYLTPKDLYVAQKIGSPTMNVIGARAGADGASVEVPFGSFPLPGRSLPAGAADLKIGIRPADIRISPGASPGQDGGIPGRVRLLEPLGDITIVDIDAADQRLKIVVRESEALSLQPGAELSFAFDPARLHVFDAASGLHMSE